MAGPLLQREGCQATTAQTVGLNQVRGKADAKGKRVLTAWITGPQAWGWARTVAAAGGQSRLGWDRVVMGTQLQKGGNNNAKDRGSMLGPFLWA